MIDIQPGPPEVGGSENQELDEAIFELLPGLKSPLQDTRFETAKKIEQILAGVGHVDLIGQLSGPEESEPFAVFGWIEYCIAQGIHIPFLTVKDSFLHSFKVYMTRKNILKYTSSDTTENIRTDLEGLAQRIRDFVRVLTQSKDESLAYYAYIFQIKTHLQIEGDSAKAIEYSLSEDDLLRDNMHAHILLAEAYEEHGKLEEACDIYKNLQPYDQSHIFIERQLFLLFRMGKIREAQSLHNFASGVVDSLQTTIRPLCYYRSTIESYEDLESLPVILDPFYGGEDIAERTITLIRSAEAFIDGELTRIQALFFESEKKGEDIFTEEWHPLWIDYLFLLETSTCVLLSTRKVAWTHLDTAGQYINVLISLYHQYREQPSGSILEKYFQKYNHAWIDRVRDIQGEENEEDSSESLGDSFIESMPQIAEEIPHSDEFGVTIDNRVDNIVNFMVSRLENEKNSNKEFRDILFAFQNEIARNTDEVDFFEEEDESFAGEFLGERLELLEKWERNIFAKTSAYISKKYGESLRQLILYFSLSTNQFTEFQFSSFKNDPHILFFALIVSLLGDEFPDRSRVASFLEEPILEALDYDEAKFLCRLLFKEGYYDELCEYILDDARLLLYPEFLEFFMVSISFLDEVQSGIFIDMLEEETLPDRFGFDNFSDFIEDMASKLSSKTKKDRKRISQLDHADMWYTYITSEDGEPEFDMIPIAPNASLSSLGASYAFSAFRMVVHSSQNTALKKLHYLDSLYPFLDLERREAVQLILSLALHTKSKDILQKYLQIAENEVIYVGPWRYAPLLLGTKHHQIEAFRHIAQSPSLSDLPNPLLHAALEFANEHMSSMDAASEEIPLENRFHISYILAYSGDGIKEKITNVSLHFSRLSQIITINESDRTLFSRDIQEIIDIFHAIGYEKMTTDPLLASREDELGNQLLHHLVCHIVEFKKYIQSVLKQEYDDFASERITQAEIIGVWKEVILSLEKIFHCYPRNSRVFLSSQSFLETLVADADKLFGESESELSSKNNQPQMPKNVIFGPRDNF